MPSPDAIATLKKKCFLALKKDMSFYFFAKAEDGEPALLIGKAAEVRSEQKDLAAKHKTKPVAQGSVKKSEDGKGLVFELLKGKPAPLKKALKSTFNEVPQLKTADVQAQSKKVSLKDKLSGAFKGGDKAFERRAGKLEEAIKGARKIIADLLKDGVTPPEADQVDDIENALEVARDLSETDPKDAYTALAPVKDDILKVTQALTDLASNLTLRREEANKHATTATTRLTEANKALTALKKAGYDGDEEATAISSAQSDIKAAQGRIQADPTGAGADLLKIADTLDTLKTAIDKKKGQSRSSVTQKVEALIKGGEDTYKRRLAKVKDEHRIVEILGTQIRSMGFLTSTDEKTLKALKEGLRIAEQSSGDSYKTAYAQLAKVKGEIAAFKKEVDGRIAQYTPLMVALSDSSARIEAARVRYAALVKAGGSLTGAETTLKGLLSALLSTEDLAASDPRQAQVVNSKLSAEIDRLHQQLDQAERAGRSTEENTFHDRIQEVRQRLEEVVAAEEKLFMLCAKQLHKDEIDAIASLIDKSEVLSQTSIKNATSQLKQARSYAEALHTQILEKIRDYPRLIQALQARITQINADLDHTDARIATIGDVRDLTNEKTTIVELRKAVNDAEGLLQTDPTKGHDDLATPAKTASQLRTAIDKIFTEEAVQIDSAASGKEPPSSQYEKNLALLRVQLRSAEALAAQIKFQSTDHEAIFKELHERLAGMPATFSHDPVQGLQDVGEVSGQINKMTAIVEGYQQGLRRINQRLALLTLNNLPTRKPIWERFLAFCMSEFSAENIPMWQGIREKRFKSPKTKKMAYLEFLTPQSPSEINVSKSDLEACFPKNQLPTQAQMDDWDFWAQVDYDPLVTPLGMNLSDTYSRFRFKLTEPVTDEIARSSINDCPKIISKWETRLG